MEISSARVPEPRNEPVLSYAPGTSERQALKEALGRLATAHDIPLVIGGEEVRTGRTVKVASPHRHDLDLGVCHEAGPDEVAAAIRAAQAARPAWSRMAPADRAAIFLRAAERLAGPFRQTLNAATMLGQSKTAHQAEIDAACETIDFFRFNVAYAQRIAEEQPLSPPGQWNQLDLRPLEGFVYAVTPFNFTSIAANLPTAPALMGNTVVWKPARMAMLAAHYVMTLLREAGLPDGVINFVPGPPEEVSDAVLAHRELAGVHFTGSTAVFRAIWQKVAARLPEYRGFPRLVGETGGKDFIVAHPSADPEALATAIVRGGYEFQGQKCSAVSRVYVPDALWHHGLKDRLHGLIDEIKVGDPSDFRCFMGAVIDEKAFSRIRGYVTRARHAAGTRVTAGGTFRDETGWFIDPTLVESEDPGSPVMSEEIFGPVVALHVYPEKAWRETLALVDGTSPYALTGAVFARDRAAILEARQALRDAAGNFYINDKPTGAVVGQQPFGGARASGTNDKAGSPWNLLRWVSPRAIKETLAPPSDFRYPFMAER
jgi:1-pyrroline-5-carboxylate dehydrogenase